MGCAKARVLHNGSHGNSGRIGRSESHVEGMIALVFGQFGCVVFVFLPDGDSLGCACFACAQVTRPCKNLCGGAAGSHADQAIANHVQVFRAEAQGGGRRARHGLLLMS